MNGPHSSGNVIDDRYVIRSFVGEGGMQFVYAAEDKVLGRKVALKTPKNTSAQKRFHRSAIVSARVNHPNVAKTLDYVERDGRAYLIEELIDGADLGKSLLKKAKRLDPYLAARVFHYLSKGLAASHRAGVIHRDLKPANVMVSGDFQLAALKITDFGIAKMAEEELVGAAEGGEETITGSQTAVGALPYMSPEAIDTPRSVGTPADVWSIGAMMYELLTGQKPFGSGLRAVNKITEATPPEFPAFITANPQFSYLSTPLIQLILSCLKKDPKDRPTAAGLAQQCSSLYYPIATRYIGTIQSIRHNAWGFIDVGGNSVFFHLDSVYGEKPAVGDTVMLSKFPGGGAWRAHPVIKMA